MAVLASKGSASVTLKIGETLNVMAGGQGVAVLKGGASKGAPIELGATSRKIGPFPALMPITINSQSGAITYYIGADSSAPYVDIAGEYDGSGFPVLKEASIDAMSKSGAVLASNIRLSDPKLSKWTIAKNKVRAGSARAKIGIITDSYGVGVFSTRWWSHMARMLELSGIKTNFAAQGTSTQTPAQLIANDPRFVSIDQLTNEWKSSTSRRGIERGEFECNLPNKAIVFRPGKAFNTVEIYHNGYNNSAVAGAYKLSVDGVDQGAVVQIQNAGGDLLVKTTFTGFTATASSTLAITSQTGSGGGNLTFISSFCAYDSSVKEVDIYAAGQAGLKLSDHLGTTAPYQASTYGNMLYPALAVHQFDLLISTYFINESDPANFSSSVTSGVYTGCLASLASRQTIYGSLILLRPPATALTGISQANQDATNAAQISALSGNNVMRVDYSQRFGSYENAVANYGSSTIYSDDRHLTDQGYADMGFMLGEILSA